MSKLVEVSVPLEAVGVVRCDFDGYYHVEVNGQEVDSDEKTYWQVVRARGGTVPWRLETRWANEHKQERGTNQAKA